MIFIACRRFISKIDCRTLSRRNNYPAAFRSGATSPGFDAGDNQRILAGIGYREIMSDRSPPWYIAKIVSIVRESQPRFRQRYFRQVFTWHS